MAGTNLFATFSDTCQVALVDENGLAMFAKCTGTLPVDANVFASGCIMIKTDGVQMYLNLGQPSSPSWDLVLLD